MAATDTTFDAFTALPLVDQTMLDNLRAALGPGTDALVTKASSIIDERLATLETLGATPLEDGVARLAHEIGGVAGQIGLSRLSKASLALEQTSRGGDAEGARHILHEIGVIAAETRTALGR